MNLDEARWAPTRGALAVLAAWAACTASAQTAPAGRTSAPEQMAQSAQMALTPGADATITAHAAHYRWAGRSFDDLDVLASTVLPRAPRSVALRACGAGAVPAFLAAAERFRHLLLELSVSEANDRACEGMPVAVAAAGGALPTLRGVDAAEVARWWEQIRP